MPTIAQLPSASQVDPADDIPISQAGVTRTASVGTLLASTQPAIIVPTGTMLGRVSLGPGGPEPLTLGAGLSITNASIAADGSDHVTFIQQTTLQPADEVVLNSAGAPKRMSLKLLRGLFSAGANVTIDATGVISGSQGSSSITGLSQVNTIAASDLVGISQGSVDHTITYANLLNGQTIDLAQPAIGVSDSDTFWIAQGSSTMLRQGFSSVWAWVAAKLPTYKFPVAELSVNTTLDGTAHNGRILICSSPLTLTPAFINMGSGFHCEVINFSSGSVTFGAGIVSSSGSPTLPIGQCASLRGATYSAGNAIFAAVSGATSTLLPPGQVVGLTVGTITSTSVATSWAVPTSGGVPTSYTVQYRVAGTTTWSSATATLPTFILAGLTASTSYNVQVIATNLAGPGTASSVSTASTSAGGLVTAITWYIWPTGPYIHASGSNIPLNVHVNPASAAVQFGFSNSATVPPTLWTAAGSAGSDLWAAYMGIPATAGTWYAWAEGTDGSAATVYPTSFTVT